MEKPFPAYTGEDSFIFVSYAHEDDALVYPELQRLKDRGFNVWYDEGISPGSEWTDALASAIERCDVFLYFVSPRSVASEHCQRELNFSLDQGCTLLVVHLEETEIPRALRLSFGNRQAIIKHELSDEVYAAKLFSGVGDQTGRSDFVSTAPLRASGSKHRSAIVGLGLAALAILVVAAIFLFRSPTSPSDHADVAIAVLPLVNMSADPSNEYFSDGVSAEILNSLVRTNTLPVIARTSSFQFKGKSLSVQEIASELNVTHLLEGSVQKVGNQVRITAQLVDGVTGVQLWSESYTRELVNIFALQDEIATAIVKEIQVHVEGVPIGREPSLRTRVVDEAAYDTYLRAKRQLQLSNPSQKEAIDLFQQAVELDPEFADAWVGLARAQMSWNTWAGIPPAQGAPQIKRALRRALDLEPDNAEALAWLGMTRALIDWEWQEGSALLERAVRLSPQDGEIQSTYATYLRLTHQPGALDAMEKAYRLDPLSPEVAINYAVALLIGGRQLDAQRIMASFLVTAAEQRNDIAASTIYIVARNLDLAEQHLEKAKAVWGADHQRVMLVEYRLARARRPASRKLYGAGATEANGERVCAVR
ncbi:MAG: TIR domain-containing protein [Gammaproteobacteria bacterium]|nr:TIR domain-containing protein [Gammaproteobacteria bacterium]